MLKENHIAATYGGPKTLNGELGPILVARKEDI